MWRDLGWSETDARHNRALADANFYRQFSYRDMGKRGGHATNYRVTPPTMARHLKIEQRIANDFQVAYFSAFPGIPLWHTWVARQLGLYSELTTPLGRRRIFYGRPDDDATLREAIAYMPQSTVGDLLNVALWRVWRHLPEVQLLAQVHDAIVFQYPEERERELIPRVLELCQIPISVQGLHESNQGQSKTLLIPAEAKVGWNWAGTKINTSRRTVIDNPNGLMKFSPEKPDQRKRIIGVERLI